MKKKIKIYEPKKGWKFTYFIHDDGEFQIFLNTKHLCYCDPDNFEESEKLESGEITEDELFKIIVDTLLDDNMSDLIEELYFENKEFEWL